MERLTAKEASLQVVEMVYSHVIQHINDLIRHDIAIQKMGYVNISFGKIQDILDSTKSGGISLPDISDTLMYYFRALGYDAYPSNDGLLIRFSLWKGEYVMAQAI